MLVFLLAILATSTVTHAAPVDDCRAAANTWMDGLDSACDRPLSRYRNAALTACAAMPEDGWVRATKTARKALLRDCAPSVDGFPGVMATREDGRTLSHCSELILMMREHPADGPTITTTTIGIDTMVAAMGAAIFACTKPDQIAACRLPASIHTPEAALRERITACEAIQDPPFDTTMHSLVSNSGLTAVDPDTQAAYLRELVSEQIRIKAQKEKELADFQEAREAEVVRARELAAQCMVLPGEMTAIEQTDTATVACKELLALWKGADAIRVELEAQGVLADHYRTRLAGKVLNGDSLNAADELRVAGRPEVLLLRKQDLINTQFETLISTDPASAEQFVDTHREQMTPEWVAEALDQILAASM